MFIDLNHHIIKMLKVHLAVFLLYCSQAIKLRHEFEDVSAQTCWKYQCTSLADNCVIPYFNNQTYLLSACPLARPYCDTSNLNLPSSCSLTYPKDQSSLFYPGEKCSINDECYSKLCISSICYGKVLNAKCQSNLECNPGLRCFEGKCLVLLRAGSICEEDYDCLPSLGCNMGICTAYLSLSSGSIVSDCNNGAQTSMFCEEFSCHYDPKKMQGTCLPAYKSVTVGQVCSSSSECVGNTVYNGEKYTKTTYCQCGMNESGNKYCFPNDGDDVTVEFRRAWKNFLAFGYLGMCNTERRFEQACFDLNINSYFYVTMLKSYYEYYHYPQLNSAPSCVKDIFFQVQGSSWFLAPILILGYLVI